MGKGINRRDISIYIVDKDTDASTLTDSDKIIGRIEDYTLSPGDQNVDYTYLFGGTIETEEPEGETTIDFEIVPRVEDELFWEKLRYEKDETAGVWVTPKEPKRLAVFIAIDDGGDNATGIAFNNALISALETSHSAEENQSKSISLTLAPETADGISNFMANSKEEDAEYGSITDLPGWSALDHS